MKRKKVNCYYNGPNYDEYLQQHKNIIIFHTGGMHTGTQLRMGTLYKRSFTKDANYIDNIDCDS
jgi:hypothetical protein